jgi:hypothetical protein
MGEPITDLGSAAMWNLSGDDVQRAKEELKGRRAAIQARYDSEIKQLETAIADLETFERAAVNFMTSFKAEDAAAIPAAEPAPTPETNVADSMVEPASAEAEAAPANEPAAPEKGSSRWRMRLSGADAPS